MTQATVSSVTLKRSSEVTKFTNRFLLVTFDSEEIETCEWSHCVFLIMGSYAI